MPLTLIIFHTLAWPDTNAAVKSIPLCDSVAGKVRFHFDYTLATSATVHFPVFQLSSNGVLDEQAAVHLFCRALAAIQMHGEHDNASTPLLTLACCLYERWVRFFLFIIFFSFI